MQPLAVLSAVFALLVGYLEWATPAPGASTYQQPLQTVIRYTSAPTRTATTPSTAPARQTATQVASSRPLILALPDIGESSGDTLLTVPGNETPLSDLFEQKSARERVTYNAELVFDRETGEDVTGGKVNIKIPLT